MDDPTAKYQWAFVDAVAAEMGVGAEARRKWRERGRVAYKWRLPILEKARQRKIKLDSDIFDHADCESAAT